MKFLGSGSIMEKKVCLWFKELCFQMPRTSRETLHRTGEGNTQNPSKLCLSKVLYLNDISGSFGHLAVCVCVCGKTPLPLQHLCQAVTVNGNVLLHNLPG